MLFDQVLTAQLVERPHGPAAEGARVAASALPFAILALSIMLVVLSVGRRLLEVAFVKHVGTGRSPSAFRMLCQELDTRLHAKPADQMVPSSRSTKRRSARLQQRMKGGFVDCCLTPAQIVSGCKVPLQAEEVLRSTEKAPFSPCYALTLQAQEATLAGEAADKIMQVGATDAEVVQNEETVEEGVRAHEKTLPMASSEEPTRAADAFGISKFSDREALSCAVYRVTTDAEEASIEAPEVIRCCKANASVGHVVEGATAGEDRGIAVGGWPQTISALRGIEVGGWPQTLSALKSALDGNDHSTPRPDTASSAEWDCSVHRVYSKSLLLVHRSLYIKISQGAPGLHRLQEDSHPASMMSKSWPAREGSCGAGLDRAAVKRLCLQTQQLFQTQALCPLPPLTAPCTRVRAVFKRSPWQHRFALHRHGLKQRSASAEPLLRSPPDRHATADLLGLPPGGLR